MALSDEDLLADLQQLADEFGRAPTLKEYREQGSHSATTYYDRFGSWQKALQAAGFKPRNRELKIPQDDLLAELTRLADELGESPSAIQMNIHGEYWESTYRRRFGSWNAALDAAGLEPNVLLHDQPIAEDKLLAELRRVAADCGSPPSFQNREDEGMYSARTYTRHFGSWNDAVEAAGFEPNRSPQEMTDEKLLAELYRLADELGERPTAGNMGEQGKYGVATYQRHFGAWSAAVEIAFETSEDVATTTD